MDGDKKTGKHRRRLSIAARCLTVLAGLLALYYIELATVQRDYFVERHGTLVDYVEHAAETSSDGRMYQNVSLTSSSGLTAELRVLRRGNSGNARLPLVLMMGGLRTGKTAVDLVADPGDVVFAAIDYPYNGPSKAKGLWQSLSERSS